jgi:hypothetical protein
MLPMHHANSSRCVVASSTAALLSSSLIIADVLPAASLACLLCASDANVCIAGLAHAQTFASVQDAVAGLPELSMLNKNTNAIALADKLRDPNFVGTLFAPTDSVSR